MKVDDLINTLNKIKEKEGNIEVVMTSTILREGYSRHESSEEDVFESTVENVKLVNSKYNKDKKVIKLFGNLNLLGF